MNWRFAVLLFFVSMAGVFAQSHQYSNFLINRSVLNPAAIGSENVIDFTALYRTQWIGIEGSPSAQTFSVHSPLNFLNSSAGIFVVNEMQGKERATYIMLSYAYRKSFNFGNIALGLSGGIIQKALDGSKLRAPQGIIDASGYNGHDDPFLPENLVSEVSGDLNLGIYFDRKNLHAGLSVSNLLESKIQLKTDGSQTEIKFPRNYIFIGGYKFDMKRKLNLQTNVIVKTNLISTQPEFNVIIQYNNNIYGGVSFRGSSKNTNDALVAMVGFTLFKKLAIGYSYDFSISSLGPVNSGSHEVYVNYKVSIKELLSPGKVIYNPRFL